MNKKSEQFFKQIENIVSIFDTYKVTKPSELASV